MSLDAKNRITIDVAGSVYTPVVRAVQEDIRSRFVEIVLIANGEPLEIPVGTHGIIGIRRPNGTHVLYDATEDETDAVTFDGNVATAYLSQQALAEPGDLYVSVSLYANSARLTAFHFIVRVDETAVPSGVVIDSDYFNILEAMIDQAVDAANRAEQAAATVGNPVGYDPQTPTAAQQAQARANIGIGNASTSAAGIVQLYDGIDSTSTTMAATAAAVKAAYEHGAGGGTNPNLLDNWYFVGGGSQQNGSQFPINQRLQTSYSGTTYGIDRWKQESGAATTVQSGYVRFANSGSSDAYIRQRVLLTEHPPFFQTLTGTILYSDGTIDTGTVYIDNDTQSASYQTWKFFTADWGWFGFELPPTGNDFYEWHLTISAGKTIDVVAIKVEIGTEQTLAYYDEDVGIWKVREFPSYGDQLLRCQRYQFLFYSGSYAVWAMGLADSAQTYARVQFPLPVPMIKQAGTTTVLAGSVTDLRVRAGGTVKSVTSIQNECWSLNTRFGDMKVYYSGGLQNYAAVLSSTSDTLRILIDTNL